MAETRSEVAEAAARRRRHDDWSVSPSHTASPARKHEAASRP